MIDFWGTWCGPCLKKIPELTGIKVKFEGKLDLLSFNYKDFDITSVKNTIEQFKMDWHHGFASHQLNSTLNPSQVYPFFLIVDDEMNLVWQGTAKDLKHQPLTDLLSSFLH